jgi:hypothetical protein
MRGGTSRGVIIDSAHLSADADVRTREILTIFGSPDRYQVDGLGGGFAQTSKLGIIGAPTRADADIDFTFAQIGIGDHTIDKTGTCGNLTAAVALYAVQEGLVAPGARACVAAVAIHNTNTGGLISAEVLVDDDPAARRERPVYLDCRAMAAGGRPAVFPTGAVREELKLDDGTRVQATLSNVGNSMMYVRAADLGLSGSEAPAELDADAALGRHLESIRAAGRRRLHAAGVPGHAGAGTRLPLISILSPAPAADSGPGGVRADVTVRLHVVGRTHVAIAGSAAVSVAAAATFSGSVPAELTRRQVTDGTVHVAHPSGVMTVDVRRTADGEFERLAYERTARRILDGVAYV